MTEAVVIQIQANENAAAAFKRISDSLEGFRKKTDRASRSSERFTKANERLGKSTQTLRRGFIALTAALGVRELVRYADAWTTVNNRLRLVTKSNEQFLFAQREIFSLAQRTRGPLEGTAELYQRLAFNAERLGLSQRELVNVTKTINKTLVISGSSAQAANAALIQLGQGIASGQLRGQELNSVLEQTPRLAQALAAGLDIPVGKLRELGFAGKITADAVIEAIQSQREVVAGEFATTTQTISQALTTIGNSFTRLIGRFSELSGASERIQGFLMGIRDALDTISRTSNLKNLTDAFGDLLAAGRELAATFGDSEQGIAQNMVRFGTISIRVAARVIRGVALIRESVQLLRDTIAFTFEQFQKADLRPLGVRILKLFINVGQLAGDIWIDMLVGFVSITQDFGKFLIAPFADTFRTIWTFASDTFRNFVLRPVLSMARGMLGVISDALSFLSDEGRAAIAEVSEGFGPILEIAEEARDGLMSFAPSTTESSSVTGAINDWREAWDQLKGTVGGVDDTVLDRIMEVGTDVSAVFEEMATIIGPNEKLQAQLADLKARFATLWDPIIVEADNAQEAMNETADAAEEMEDRVDGVATRLGKSFREGLVKGVQDYRDSLGTVASQTASAVNDALQTLESGVNKGINALIFGSDQQDAAKDAIKDLKEFRDDFSRPLATQSPGLLETTLSGFSQELEDIADGDLTGKAADRIQALSNDILKIPGGTTSQAGILGDTDRIIDQLESQTGLLGRIKEFGSSLRGGLQEGFENSVTSLLTAGAMAGLLDFGTAGVGFIRSKGAALIGGLFDGAEEENEKRSEDAKDIGSSIAGKIGEGFSGATDLGGDLGGAVGTLSGHISGFETQNKGRLAGSITSGFGAVWELGGKLAEQIGIMAGNIAGFGISNGGKLAGALSSGMTGVWDFGRGTSNLLSTIAGHLSGFIQGGNTGRLSSALSSGMNTVFDFGRRTGDLVGAIAGHLNGFVQGGNSGKIAGVLSSGMSAVFDFGRRTGGLLTTMASQIGGFASGNTGRIANALGSGMTAIWDFGRRTGDLVGAIAGHLNGFIQGGNSGKLSGALSSGMSSIWGFGSRVGTTLTDIGARIGGFASGNTGRIANAIGSGMTAIWDFGRRTGDLVGAIAGHLNGFIQGGNSGKLSGALSSGMSAVFDFGSNIDEMFIDVGGSISSFVTDHGGAIAGAISDGLSDLASFDFNSIFAPVTKKIEEGLSSTFGGIGEDVGQNFGQAFVNGFIAFKVADEFLPDGKIGALIGSSIGTLLGSSFGGILGGLAGAAIESSIRALSGSGGATPTQIKEQTSAGNELSAILQQTGGAKGLLRASGGIAGVGEFLADGGFARAYQGLILDDFLRSGLKNAFIAEGFDFKEAQGIIDFIVDESKGRQSESEAIVRGLFPNEFEPILPTNSGGNLPGNEGPLTDPAPPPPPLPPATKPTVPSGNSQAIDYVRQVQGSRAASAQELRVFGQKNVVDAMNIVGGFHGSIFGAMAQIAAGANVSTQEPHFRLAGYTLSARRGLRRVPGSDDTAVPAILHGGEMVVPANRVRQFDEGGGSPISMSFNNTIVIEGGDSDSIMRDLESRLGPMQERQILEVLERSGRFGRLEVASRSIRGVTS